MSDLRTTALERLWWSYEDAAVPTLLAMTLWILAVPAGVLGWEIGDRQSFGSALTMTFGVNFFAMSMFTAPMAWAAWQYALDERRGTGLLIHAALTFSFGAAFLFG